MLHHNQFISNISPNTRQQSSPSDDSMSTATPPHQISRASPASTALVMSSNNINQPTSRQLTPSTNNGSSLNSNNSGSGNDNQQSNISSNGCPPNPMIRQFASHTKSMSAGIVVPVPGISNNLATATGMNQNNVINNHHQQQQQMHHMRQVSGGRHPLTVHETDASDNNMHEKQQAIRDNHHRSQNYSKQPQQMQQHQINQLPPSSYHHRSQSSQHHLHHHHHQQQQQQQQQQQEPQLQQFHNQEQQHHQIGSNQNFLTARHQTGSSIILSNNNINYVHNRSASTHLSNVLLGPQHHHQHIQQQRNYPQHVTNSILSIDENISKSHGKLTASGYIPQMFNPSIGDLSCDTASNFSRLLDGPPAAPGYYLHPQGGGNHNLPLHSSKAHLSIGTASNKTPEFLPICDLIFNLISMIIYFCENVFGIIALIALYYHATSKYWALIGATFVVGSNFICQYLSLKWLFKMKLEDCKRKREAQEQLENEENCVRDYNRMPTNMRTYQCGSCTWLPDGATEVQLKFLLSTALDAVVHIFCLGFLGRYIRLVIPVTDTSRVKREARDLCMLRMIHGFIQSSPLLLIQSYMLCSQNNIASISNLSITSAILSLANVCWAMASFTKYARKKYMSKFVLTWLGIISQFLWRLGTISARVVALIIYAVNYHYWMIVVLSLHWLTMFLWFIKPGNLLRDEDKMSRSKRFSLAVGVAWIHCFCYLNLDERKSKTKMQLFYLIMFIENNLLLTVCQLFATQVTWLKHWSMLIVYLGFFFGIFCMWLYYKQFHVKVLSKGQSCSQESIDSIADQLSPAGKKITGFNPGTLRQLNENTLTSSGLRFSSNIENTVHTGSQPEITRNNKPPYLASNHEPMIQSGIFSCKLNQSMKKEKIPVRRHNS